MDRISARATLTVAAAVAVAAIIAAFFIAFTASARSAPKVTFHDPVFSKGGQSLTVSVGCSASETIITKISGSHVSYAARTFGGRPGHWVQGGTVFSGSSTAIIAQATNHGVRVNWSAGAQNYSGIC